MTSTYKIANHVLDVIDLTSSFNFFTTNAISSSLNLEKIATTKKLYFNDSQEKGAKIKRVKGRRGLTLIRIILRHNKNFR
jgi:hypothetical protein